MPNRIEKMSKANRGFFVVGAVVSAVGLALYPVAIHPKLFPQKYQRTQKEFREGIVLNDSTTRPGGMKVWSDPFKRK